VVALSLTSLRRTPPRQDGEENQKEKSKTCGLAYWDKNNLTEPQREKKITSRKLIKRIYRVQFSYCLKLSSLPSSKSPSSSQLPHSNTEHGVIWYQISHSIG